VLRYTSDLPMIPITLTQVGAIPNMGVLVWVLGESRAIPRNYYHTVLDEIPVWLGFSYQSTITAAVTQAPGKHSFVTEYAGSSNVMSQQLYYPGRFGSLAALRTMTDPVAYIDYLKFNGYIFDSTLYALLERFLPMPEQARANGITEQIYYDNFDYYSQQYAVDFDGGVSPTFDPVGLTDAIDMRIVTPIKTTQSLFDAHPYLTRLYTTISPKDMNLDPVFSQNPDLPEVRLLHTATLTIPCSGDSWLSTDQGFEVQYQGTVPPYGGDLPPLLRTETLREAGAPQVVTDNSAAIKAQLGTVTKNTATNTSTSTSSSGRGGCACDVSTRTRNQLGTGLMVMLAVLLVRRRRRA